ncbi:oxidase [Lithospermum erythrorhizon]|uniref:L-gulonolactone oxidase n=1 Tax=Lithospermum erythrorhizon TaxID=34254 RepID=A0AAV3RSC6_LITER
MAALWLFTVTILCCFPKLPLYIQAMPPPNPIKCNSSTNICTLQNSYAVWGDRKECQVVQNSIIYPTNEEELRLAVANANKKRLKVKVVTKFSHTIPKLACPSNNNNNNSSLIISTERYDSIIDVDVENLSVTADAGVGLRAMIDRVAAFGLSLVASPYWEGVSVGGMISTGAHGSSWWGKGGSMHDHVIGMRLIVPAKQSQGYAQVVEVKGQDPLLRAAKVSLGVLGVISKVTLSLERGFKRSVTYNFTNDDDFEHEFMDLAKRHEFADIQWYPSRHTVVYRNDDRVPINTPGDGVNDFLGFQQNSVLVSQSLRATERSFENSKSVKGKCILASSFVGYKKTTANGLKNNNLIFTNYPVIGHQSKIQTSGSCLYSSPTRKDLTCPWDPRIKGLFFFETTSIIPAHKFPDFIRDIKTLLDLNPENFCGVDMYNGFLFRFVKSSDAYLGQSEDSIVVDFNYYRSDDPKTPRLNEDVWEEVEQIAFFKYGGKPHWGKNRKVAFLGVDKKFGNNFNKFIEAKNLLDPQKMFSTEWSDEILFGSNNKFGDGCALEGECICSEDRHCNPVDGYFCRPGLVYDQARVCRYSIGIYH